MCPKMNNLIMRLTCIVSFATLTYQRYIEAMINIHKRSHFIFILISLPFTLTKSQDDWVEMRANVLRIPEVFYCR
jgi:hypothetical protein